MRRKATPRLRAPKSPSKNASGGRVYVKGTWYDDGADVMTIRTDKNGHATIGMSDLPFGIYA